MNDVRPKLLPLLAGEGITDEEAVDRIIEISVADPETEFPGPGRLVANAYHRRQCVKAYLAEIAGERRDRRAAEPTCPDCGRPMSQCERERFWPLESRCRRHDQAES